MNTVAIVAIVAMLFAFMGWFQTWGSHDRAAGETSATRPIEEVILHIDPPPARVMLNLSLPERNPRR